MVQDNAVPDGYAGYVGTTGGGDVSPITVSWLNFIFLIKVRTILLILWVMMMTAHQTEVNYM